MPDPGDILLPDGARTIRLADARRGLAQPQRSQVDLRELGLPGTRFLAGQVFDDPNQALQGLRGLTTLQQMSMDPTVAALLRAVELPIRSAKWTVEPASEDPLHVKMADLAHTVLWEFGTQSFDDVLRQALQMDWAGFSVSEIVYDIVPDGEFASYIGWNKLAYRVPESKWKWNVEEVDSPNGSRIRQLVSMTQRAAPYYQEVVIPREKLLLWVHDQLAENFDGRALIRQCYEPWFYKTLLLKIQAVGLERSYIGIPHVSYPEDFSANEVAAAKQIGQNLRVSENAAVIAPEHIGVNIITNRVEGTAMQEAINFYDTAILMAALAQFVALGTKNVGSYALSQDQTELFLMADNAVANHVAEVFNLAPGLPTLMRYNFPDITSSDMPRLVHGMVGQGRSFDRLARGLAALSQWGILTPDDSMEDWVREQLEAPERDNSVTDASLRDLIEQVSGPEQAWIRHEGPRYPIPGTSATAPMTVGARPAAPATNGTAQAAATFSEAWVRRPWQRPLGRLTYRDRHRIRATEEFFGALEDVRHDLGHKPEWPSVRLAKRRRPYRLRMSEKPAEVVRRVEADAKAGRLKPVGKAEAVVVPAHQVVAQQYEGRLASFLAGLGSRNGASKEGST